MASTPLKVTGEAARRFLVARHLLAPVHSLEGGPDAVLKVFRHSAIAKCLSFHLRTPLATTLDAPESARSARRGRQPGWMFWLSLKKLVGS